jgi:hypothetical protein
VGTRNIRGRGFRTKAIRGEAIGSAARQGKPRRSGASTSWKGNQDEAYQHQQQIAAVLRLKRISVAILSSATRPSGFNQNHRNCLYMPEREARDTVVSWD